MPPDAQGQPARKRPRPAIVLGIVGLAVAAGVLFTYWSYAYVTPVAARADGPIVRAAARSSGLLADVRVQEGDAVKAGQVVARLDADDAQAALLQAQAEVAEARAKLAASTAGIAVQQAQTRLDRAEAETQGASARAGLATAHATVGYATNELARMRTLASQGFVTPQDLEKARLSLDTAKANVDAAEALVRRAGSLQAHAEVGPTLEAVKTSDVAADQAQLNKAEAHVTIAKLRLQELDVRAPVAGLVVRRVVEPGEPVSPGETVVAIVDPARLWVDAQVEEAEAPRLRQGQAALVRFEALPGRSFTGHVAFVAGATEDVSAPAAARPAATPEPVTQAVRVPVRIRLDQPDPALRPGLSAYVRIDTRK